MPARTTEQSDFIKANFQSIWPVHLGGFTHLLAQLRDHFDGDLDLMLILAVIGERMRPESWIPELLTSRQMTKGGDAGEPLQYPINIQSVSEYSGIPRETVRRKVEKLRNKGWVTRDTDGRLAVSQMVAQDLEAATNDTLAYLEALLIVFDAARERRG